MTDWKERLQDGRRVWYGGELVTRIAEHHAFRGTVETIGKLLEMQRGAWKRELTRDGAHLSFLVPATLDDLRCKARAYQIWADATFGMMSRLSEYSREIETGWYANRKELAAVIPHFEAKMERIYRNSRDRDLLSTAAAQDLQRNRSRSSVEVDAGQLRVVKKTAEGVIVRGAKTVATAAPYVDEFIITSFYKRSEAQRALANVFIIPANLPGVHIVCRESFASDDAVHAPLSARYDEMDAVLIFEDALIPWDLVLVAEDPEAAWKLHTDPVAVALSQHQTVVRLISKLRSVAAIAYGLAKSADVTGFLHVRNDLANLILQVETIEALLGTAQQTGDWHNGVFIPNRLYLGTARNLGTRFYAEGIAAIHRIGASGLLQAPASLKELDVHPEWREYFAASDGFDGTRRTLLNKLAWDFAGSSLGSRHELYERFYAGDPVRNFASYYNQHPKRQAYVEFALSILREENR